MIGSLYCLCSLWLARVITLVLVLRHSNENRSKNITFSNWHIYHYQLQFHKNSMKYLWKTNESFFMAMNIAFSNFHGLIETHYFFMKTISWLIKKTFFYGHENSWITKVKLMGHKHVSLDFTAHKIALEIWKCTEHWPEFNGYRILLEVFLTKVEIVGNFLWTEFFQAEHTG